MAAVKDSNTRRTDTLKSRIRLPHSQFLLAHFAWRALQVAREVRRQMALEASAAKKKGNEGQTKARTRPNDNKAARTGSGGGKGRGGNSGILTHFKTRGSS